MNELRPGAGRPWPRAFRIAALLAATLVSLAACSSGGSVSGGGTAESTGSTSSASSQEQPIKIGFIAAVTGAESPGTAEGVAAARARVAAVNAKGGVAGHQIDLDVADDQSTSQGALTAAQTLVSDGVVGVEFTSTAVEGPAEQYLSRNNIPMAALDADPAAIADPNVYSPLGASGPSVPANASLGLFLKSRGVTKAAGVAWGVAAVAVALMEAPLKAAASVGVKTVLQDVSPTPATSDFTPDALKIKSSGAQGLYAAMSNASDTALAQALQQQNVSLKAQVYAATVYEKADAAEPALNGAYVQAWFAPTQAGTPAVSGFAATLQKYAPGIFPGLSAELSYVETDLLITGLQAVKTGGHTTASLGHAIKSLTAYEGAGLIPQPINFTMSNTSPVNLEKCYWYPQIKNGTFLLASPKPICS